MSHPGPSPQLLSLLAKTLRVTVLDGRIFIGTFAGTDKPLNIILVNTFEFRLGPDEDPNGRYVGQALIPWKILVKAEVESAAITAVPHLSTDESLYS
jgi:small nuclear ribonucleoprotein (snRNP)-like protein